MMDWTPPPAASVLAYTDSCTNAYRCHRKLVNISVETFDAIHYGGMAVFKFGVLLFNLVPYLALKIVG